MNRDRNFVKILTEMTTLKVSSSRMYLFGDEVRARTDFLELGNIS